MICSVRIAFLLDLCLLSLIYTKLTVINFALDGRLRLDPSPYTMVEGFLQLIQPLKQE